MVRLCCFFLFIGFSLPAAGLSGRRLLLSHQFVGKDTPAASGAGPGRADESAVPLTEATVPLSLIGICQDTSKKLVRSLFIPEEPQQGLCPYASLPQDIFLT